MRLSALAPIPLVELFGFTSGDRHGNGIRIPVKCEVELVVRHLFDGSIAKSFIRLERVDGGGQKFCGEIHEITSFLYCFEVFDTPV